MTNIYEYEFKVTRKNGKKETIQQSEHTQPKAKRRILNKVKGIKEIKFSKRFSYPHLEKGKKV